MSTVPTVGVRFWNRSLSVTRERNLRRYFRGDAAFAAPDIYEFLESEGFLYAIRVAEEPNSSGKHCPPADPPRRSSGRTMYGAITPASGIRLEVGTGSGAWWPRWNGTPASCAPASALLSPTCHGPPNGLVAFYNHRGTAEQYIKEGKYAIKWTRLSCSKFRNKRGSAPVSRPGLQSGQLHADACIAEGGGTLVADHATGKAGEDRAQSCPPWPLCHVPTGRGRRVENLVPENLGLD